MLNVDIKNLQISKGNRQFLDISFKISTSTALIGESGSGKSLTLKALLNLLPNNLSIKKDICSNFDLNSKTIGFIPQNPFTSLSPMTKIKHQFSCQIERIKEDLILVDLPLSVLEKFPSQLSGGQVQRVVIAIALSRNIKLLLLDEPTTALDKENKDNIINLINKLITKLDILILFVTHDINSIQNLCKQMIVIKNGKIVEMGSTDILLKSPKEEYTKTLVNSTFQNKEFRK